MRFRYYATNGPISLTNVPKGFVHHQNFNGRMYIPSIGKKAFGLVEYDHPLQEVALMEHNLVEELHTMLAVNDLRLPYIHNPKNDKLDTPI